MNLTVIALLPDYLPCLNWPHGAVCFVAVEAASVESAAAEACESLYHEHEIDDPDDIHIIAVVPVHRDQIKQPRIEE